MDQVEGDLECRSRRGSSRASASTGLVAPISWRAASTASAPSSTSATSGPPVMKETSSPKNGLLGVLGVVLVGDRLVGLHQLQRGDAQPLALEAGDHLAGEAALEGVGLDQDQGAGGSDMVGASRVSGAGLVRSAARLGGRASSAGAGRARRRPRSRSPAVARRAAGARCAWSGRLPRTSTWMRRRASGCGRGLRSGGWPPARGASAPSALRGSSGTALPRLRGGGSSDAQLGLAVGADGPARVDRLAAGEARILEPVLAVGAAQVAALDRVLAVRAGLLGQLAHPQLGGLRSRARARGRPRGTPAGAGSCRRSCR